MPDLTVSEAATRLGVTPARVRQLIGEGRLKAHKVGRDWHVKPSALARYGQPKKPPKTHT